jgi:MFS family permease
VRGDAMIGMMSIAPASVGDRRFPGWKVVAAAFVILAVTAGLGFYGLGVYLNAFVRERGWSVQSMSWATTLFFLVSGVTGLLAARWMARRDVRQVVVTGGLVGGAALAALGRADQLWQVYVAYAVMAVGFSLAGLVPATTVVTRWYHTGRSTALSIASTGLSFGGVLLTPVAKWLIDEHGLAQVTPWLGLVWASTIVPITIVMLLPEPQRRGWLPDGQRVRADEPVMEPAGMLYGEATRHRFFVAVTAGYVLLLGSQVGGIQQLVKLVEERTTAEAATIATSVVAVASVVARLVGGQVVRRVPAVTFTVVLGTVQGMALLALAFAGSTTALFASATLFGLTVGNVLMMQPLLIAERFGVRDYPRIFGRSQFIAMFGTAVGPLLLGVLRDNAGGYRSAYAVAAAIAVCGAAVLASGAGANG